MLRFLQRSLRVSLLLTLLIGCHPDDEPITPDGWDYENTDWHTEGYTECAGKVQSPININPATTIRRQLPSLSFHYQAMPLTILNNGHTIEVIADGKSYVQLGGLPYTLKQAHFHRASEHTVQGQSQSMELHLVHQDEATKNVLVVAVLLGDGATNPALQPVFRNLPATKQTQPIIVSGVTINPGDWLPADRSYYRYAGSLTTPPCTQGLDWVVFKSPVALSADQQATFSQLYPRNNRPVQPLNTREVFEQD